MASTTMVTVDEYLNTSYRPDRDYVEGHLVERNLGEQDHSDLQTELAVWFRTRRRQLKLRAYVEQRVQISDRRFRVPDICVVAGRKPPDQIFRDPPHICIEVLSKDDSLASVQERIDDYLAFGVKHVWLINPRNRRAWTYSADGSHEAKNGVLRAANPEVVLPLAEVFAEIDAAE